jgi:hypothetical protein
MLEILRAAATMSGIFCTLTVIMTTVAYWSARNHNKLAHLIAVDHVGQLVVVLAAMLFSAASSFDWWGYGVFNPEFTALSRFVSFTILGVTSLRLFIYIQKLKE